jgi:hypothetical protein
MWQPGIASPDGARARRHTGSEQRAVLRVSLGDIRFVRTVSRPRESTVQLYCGHDLVVELFERGPRSTLISALYARRRRLFSASRSA